MSKRNKRQKEKLKSLQAKKRRIINNIDTLLQSSYYDWDKLVPINQSRRNRLLSLVKPKQKKYVKLSEDEIKVSTIYNIYTQAVRDMNGDIKRLHETLGTKRKKENEYTGENEGMVLVTSYNAWDRKEFENKLFKDYNFTTINDLPVKTNVNDIYQSLTHIYDDMDSNDTLVLTIIGKNATVEFISADKVKRIDKDEKI